MLVDLSAQICSRTFPKFSHLYTPVAHRSCFGPSVWRCHSQDSAFGWDLARCFLALEARSCTSRQYKSGLRDLPRLSTRLRLSFKVSAREDALSSPKSVTEHEIEGCILPSLSCPLTVLSLLPAGRTECRSLVTLIRIFTPRAGIWLMNVGFGDFSPPLPFLIHPCTGVLRVQIVYPTLCRYF